MVQHDNNNNTDLEDKGDVLREEKIKEIEYWQNEHGQPSFEYLQSLVDAGKLEKLKSIAEDLDAEFSPGASADDLIESIRMVMGNDSHTTT